MDQIDLNIDLLVECYHYAKYIVDDVEEGGVQGNAGMGRDVQGCVRMCKRKYGEVAEKSTIFIRGAPLCGAAIQCPPQVMADAASFPRGLVASRRYHSFNDGCGPSL